MAKRTGQLASETTNWIPLGITLVMIGLMLMIFFFQMVTSEASDFGNPFSGASVISPAEIIQQQAGERSVSMIGSHLLLYDGVDDGVYEPFREDIRHSLYCTETGDPAIDGAPPDCEIGMNAVSFEYDEYNETVWFLAGTGAHRFQVSYAGGSTVLESTSREQGVTLNATFDIASFRYELPMKGGTMAPLAYQIESPNAGGIRWSHP
jgi:hypothetical protein